MKQIIVMDDDPDIREALELILNAEDYRVVSLVDDRQLEEKIALTPDLFIIDRYLDGSDGLDICRHLKEIPEYHKVPVMMISGDADIERRAREAGADLVLRKPFRIKLIREMVARALCGKYRQE